MIVEFTLLILLTIFASTIGTLTGFGTSTIMVPVLLLFFPLPVTLLFTGAIHWLGDIWKMLFFRSGIRWHLLLVFGGSGLIASYAGASLIMTVPEQALSRLIGVFLLLYVVWIWLKPEWKIPERNTTALTGGVLSGFFAGAFGIGGEMRSAFLAAYNLRKEVYLFTSGAIAFVIDSTRLATYWHQGIRLPDNLLIILIAGFPASLLGAYIAKQLVVRIPQKQFRTIIAFFLALVALRLLT